MSQSLPQNTRPHSGDTLIEQELIASVAWFIRLRWLAALGVLGATWFSTAALHIQLPALPLYVLGLALLAYNALFRISLDRLLRPAAGPRTRVPGRGGGRAEPRTSQPFDVLTKIQISLDWLAMIALIHFSGGLDSPAVLYFFFHVILASLLLSPRATYFCAAAASLLVAATTGLEYSGLWPHVFVPELAAPDLYRVPTYLAAKLLFFVSAMFVVAFLASTLNSRLRERQAKVVELSRRLQRAYERLQTLYQGAQAVNSTLELQQVLDRLVQQTAKAMGIRACSIRLLDETGTRLSVAAVYGLSEAYVQKGDLVLVHNPLAQKVLAGNVVVTEDVATDARLQYPAAALAEGIRSMLSAPLQGKQRTLGLIRAYSADPKHFTPDDAAFLTAIASQGSIAIENALAYQALAKLDQMKSQFALTVTHELRSPVSVVRSLLRTMAGGYAGALSDAQQDIVLRALRRADFLQTLIDDLLDLAAAKSELGEREVRVPVSLEEAVARVVQRFQVPAQEAQIDLAWRCEGTEQPPTIMATPEGVDRILNNLVSNAIKYTPKGGRVTVTLSCGGGSVDLEVMDTGIGIPADAVPHVFEEFYRAPNAKAQEKEGTGLGLAISKDLVLRYGGEIGLWSAVGQGSVFTVTFPVVPRQADRRGLHEEG